MKQFVFLGIVSAFLSATSVIMGQSTLPVDHTAAGVRVLVPDHWFFKVGKDNALWVDPYTDIFGDGTIAVAAGTYAEGEIDNTLNFKVGFIYPDGRIEEHWAFYSDNGSPYTANINNARTSGNAPRIACDRRPDGTRYLVGAETTVYAFDAFRSDNRWDHFSYDIQMAACQLFDKTQSGTVPITDVFDPIYGAGNIAGAQNGQQIRFGGEIRFLSNGNFITVPDDRSNNIVQGRAPIVTIFNGETGAVITGPFNGRGDSSIGASFRCHNWPTLAKPGLRGS